MKKNGRSRQRDEPFREALTRSGGDPGRRQAQRLTHRLLRRTRQQGHHALADWLGDGFRTGRLTVDGPEAEPGALALTLAAVRIRDFVEIAETTGRGEHGSALLYFDSVDAGERAVPTLVHEVDLLDVEAGELVATVRAATFGMSGDDRWHRLRYVGLCELAPDPHAADDRGTLDLWDSVPPDDRSRRLVPGRATLRVRFGWSDAAGGIHLARLEQVLRIAGAPRRTGASCARLLLDGPPVMEPVSDSRQAADRWERVLLDGFVVNQTVGELMATRGPRC